MRRLARTLDLWNTATRFQKNDPPLRVAQRRNNPEQRVRRNMVDRTLSRFTVRTGQPRCASHDQGGKWRAGVHPHDGGWSAQKIQLIRAPFCFFLVPNVTADDLFIPANSRYLVAPGPDMLPHKVALPLPVDPRPVDRALPLDKLNQPGNRVLRWYRNQHVNMIRHQIPFRDPALLLTARSTYPVRHTNVCTVFGNGRSAMQ